MPAIELAPKIGPAAQFTEHRLLALPAPNGHFRDQLNTLPPRTPEWVIIDKVVPIPSGEVRPTPSANYPEEFRSGLSAVRAYRRLRRYILDAGGRIESTYLALDKDQDSLRGIYERFNGEVDNNQHFDVYNITPPITFGGKTVLGGRVQSGGLNLNSMGILFEIKGDKFVPMESAVWNRFEDPSLVKIINEKGKEELVVYGVEVTPDASGKLEGFKTVFYGTEDFDLWRRITEGPPGMKDLRIGQREGEQEISFFGRPQHFFANKDYGKGNITFGAVSTIKHVNPESIETAKPIDKRLPHGEWGGVNRMRMIPSGLILAEAHRSFADYTDWWNVPLSKTPPPVGRHYFPWLFLYDPLFNRTLDIGIIAESSDGISLRREEWEFRGRARDLHNVIFTGGIDERNRLWFGRNDLWAQRINSSIIEYHMNNMDYYRDLLLQQREA